MISPAGKGKKAEYQHTLASSWWQLLNGLTSREPALSLSILHAVKV
jgi:hypothetical protein